MPLSWSSEYRTWKRIMMVHRKKVCERWLKFDNFLSDMGPRTGSSVSLVRKNRDGKYEPSNCQWGKPPKRIRLHYSLHAERHHSSKLTGDQVKKIVKLHKLGYTQTAIAKRYKTSQTTVNSIISGRTWGRFLRKEGITPCP